MNSQLPLSGNASHTITRMTILCRTVYVISIVWWSYVLFYLLSVLGYDTGLGYPTATSLIPYLAFFVTPLISPLVSTSLVARTMAMIFLAPPILSTEVAVLSVINTTVRAGVPSGQDFTLLGLAVLLMTLSVVSFYILLANKMHSGTSCANG